ncbi:MAG: TFIIB-type zinc ribbon-containing protein, partial [Brachybacterium sp.]|nr:TFIIB-type zinc ribbon-containing protein [Brachybacterium sp.]
GEGEVETRRYTVTVGSGKNRRRETRYDADVYKLGRRFGMTVDDLVSESSAERSDMNTQVNSNNVLNAVQPFDTKEVVCFNSNYLSDFTSERRDLDVTDIDDRVQAKFLAMAREQAGRTIRQYDRGVRWDEEGIGIRGTRWLSVYLPVWMYSYYQRRPDGTSFVHYIAVNGRSGETMGSVPVSHPRIFGASCLAGLGAFLITLPMVGFFFF